MKQFRFTLLLFVAVLFGLTACQAAPLAQAVVPLSAAPTKPAIGATSVPPTAVPTTLVPTVVSAQALTTLSSKTFQLPMTARFGAEWSIQDEYADVVTLVGPAELAFIIVKDVKIADPMTSFSEVAFPDDFVGWIKSHGLFSVVDTHPVVVGGIKVIEINTQVTADCGTKRDWLFLAQTGWNCRKGEYYHFILLNDVYGRRVLIMNTGGDDFSAEHFKAQVAASQQVLDTVIFSKPAAAIPTAPQLVEYQLPTAASEPGGIVAGPDGALWFVETAVNKIGRISTTGVVTEYPVPTASAIDTDQGFLAVGRVGELWFNEDVANQIGRITTGGQVTEYKLPADLKPTQDDAPIRAIVAGPDGALWVTSPGANAIVRLTMDGKVTTKYTLPKADSNPVGMVIGPDGALWFVEDGVNQIGRITLDGKLSEYALADNSKALQMTVGPDKALWFTLYSANKIGRIGTDGKLTTFDAEGMGPVGITSGADGALWFTGYASNEIGRMTTDGKLTKIQVPTAGSVPYHITAGPDGNLWFTEQQGNQIGQIKLSVPTSAQPAYEMPTAKVLAEWKVNNPSGIFIGFNSVWVPGHHDSTTTRIDPATNQVSAVIQGTGDHAEQALAVGDALWVTGQRDDTTWLDPKTNTVTKTALKIKGEHHYIANGFNSLWITTGDNKLDRVDPATSKIIASIPYATGFADCQAFVVATSAAVWVEDCDTAEVIRVDPATNSVVSKTAWTTLIEQAKAQTTIAAGKGTDLIWIYIVGSEGGGGIPAGLLRIDPKTGTGLTFLPTTPDQVGDGNAAVADNAVWLSGNGHIIRVNVATNQIDATYKVDPGTIIQLGIGFGSVWLENYEENLVQRLDIAP